MYKKIIRDIIDTMNDNNYSLEELETTTSINERKEGKKFSLNEHLEGLIWSLLSNQRPWRGISENKDNIREIFHDFDYEYVMNEDPEVFIDKLRKIKCGNRNIKRQMYALKYNIELFLKISEEFGSMDNFVNSDTSYNIAKKISSGEYKLKEVGIALAMEYLRNVGIDTIKPDTHICRILGRGRLALSSNDVATVEEAIDIIQKISDDTGLSLSQVDYILWQFCADHYAQICTKTPRCDICRLNGYCKYNK